MQMKDRPIKRKPTKDFLKGYDYAIEQVKALRADTVRHGVVKYLVYLRKEWNG